MVLIFFYQGKNHQHMELLITVLFMFIKGYEKHKYVH